MKRSAKRRIDGVLLLDKPAGPSSNAVLQQARRLLGAASAGHTGTLDPMAQGLLVLCFGEATKFSAGLLEADKSYRACLALGVTTSTGDAQGEVLRERPVDVTAAGLEGVLGRFRGRIPQVPPMHSALKHEGRPLYSYARKGQVVERAVREVVIHELSLTGFDGRRAELEVTCSKGTYIRTLAEDIGEALGCGAHVAALVRTRVGPFRLEEAVALEALAALPEPQRERRLLPAEALLWSRPRVALDAPAGARFLQGQSVATGSLAGSVTVFGPGGRFLGTGEVDAAGRLRPRRVVAAASPGGGETA